MFSREDDTGYIAVRNALAEELGLHPSVLEAEREAKRTSIADLTVNADGSYTVLGIDRFDDEFWVERKYTGRNARNRALAQARTLTAEGMKLATDACVAVVYYAYNPQGCYIGGDTWNKE